MVNGVKVYNIGTQVQAQDAKKLATISTVLWVVGGAAALGGTAVWFFSGSSGGDTKTALAPVLTGDSVGIALSGGF